MNTERLLKLADHLEHGTLHHDHFDFSYYSARTSCGTFGCALGECPTIWPKDWAWTPWESSFDSDMRRLVKPNGDKIDVGTWFEISSEESLHLFCAGSQEPDKYGGRYLTDDATKEQVASNIRAFVEKGNG